jgi:hypothetical protein
MIRQAADHATKHLADKNILALWHHNIRQ